MIEKMALIYISAYKVQSEKETLFFNYIRKDIIYKKKKKIHYLQKGELVLNTSL